MPVQTDTMNATGGKVEFKLATDGIQLLFFTNYAMTSLSRLW